MNIIKRYLEYRRNGKEVRHDEYILPEREEELGIGALVLGDEKRLEGITKEDLKGEDREAIELYKRR